jgi:ADP-ribose pyrophosphatase YjhB (NUDIX family)
MGERLRCPHCGGLQDRWDQPRLTVDALVFDDAGRVLLIERRGDPPGWAVPGGFVDAGETLEAAAARELLEETGLAASRLEQFHTYSDPARDPRHPTVTLVFLAEAAGTPRAADDAADARFFPPDALPPEMAFDHREVVADAVRYRETGVRPGVLD